MFTGIGGLRSNDAAAINDVRVLGVHHRDGEIAATNLHRRARIVGSFVPVLAAIIGSIKAHALVRGVFGSHSGGEGHIEATRLAGRDSDVRLHEIVRQASLKLLPGSASVIGLK